MTAPRFRADEGFPADDMTNPHAERVRAVARLATRAGRGKRGLFLAEGPQAVREALRQHHEQARAGGPAVVQELYATTDAMERHPELRTGTPAPRLATAEVLAAMADTVTPQGVIAVCRIPEATLEDIVARQPRLVAILCRVQDPGNAGTVLRAADAAGADAVILTAGSVDIFNPKAVRATAGSLFHLPIATGVAFADAVRAVHDAGATVLAADGYGDVDLDELQDASAVRRMGSGRGAGGADEPGAGVGDAGGTPHDGAVPRPGATAGGHDADARPPLSGPGARPARLESPTAWLFGNEAQGLAEAELAAADHRVAVPLYGVAESLNVGTAATVCLYASARAQNRSRVEAKPL